jgi:uncharacterized protein (TIGR00255 family)
LYKEKELELRTEIGKQLERGKVDVTVFTETTQESTPTSLNKTLAKAYFNELKSLSQELNEGTENLLSIVVKMPDVLKAERETVELDEKEWSEVKATVNRAIEAFQKFRDDEGKTLENEFNNRIGIIAKLLNEVLQLDDARVTNIKNRIKNNLEEVIDTNKIDQNRFEQELIYYIEKLDITEEKLRLKNTFGLFQ